MELVIVLKRILEIAVDRPILRLRHLLKLGLQRFNAAGGDDDAAEGVQCQRVRHMECMMHDMIKRIIRNDNQQFSRVPAVPVLSSVVDKGYPACYVPCIMHET